MGLCYAECRTPSYSPLRFHRRPDLLLAGHEGAAIEVAVKGFHAKTAAGEQVLHLVPEDESERQGCVPALYRPILVVQLFESPLLDKELPLPVIPDAAVEY